MVKHTQMTTVNELFVGVFIIVGLGIKGLTVIYPGRLGARYTGLGAQTLAPKKGFLTFYLTIFFKHPRRSVSLFKLRNLENVLK